MMDDNPYTAPQAVPSNSAKLRPTHSARRGATVGAITGASLIPLLAVYTIYRNKSMQGVAEHVYLIIGLTFALSVYGALVGMAIVAVARRIQSRISASLTLSQSR